MLLVIHTPKNWGRNHSQKCPSPHPPTLLKYRLHYLFFTQISSMTTSPTHHASLSLLFPFLLSTICSALRLANLKILQAMAQQVSLRNKELVNVMLSVHHLPACSQHAPPTALAWAKDLREVQTLIAYRETSSSTQTHRTALVHTE